MDPNSTTAPACTNTSCPSSSVDDSDVATNGSTVLLDRPPSQYGGEFFNYFAGLYEPIHLPLSLIICLLGVVANASNVIVLTRRSMVTPTNIVLTGLSAAQLFLLVNYLLLLTFNVCANNCVFPELHSYSAMTYKWINVNVSVAFHTTALCHTLVLAIFRFLAIKAPAFTRANLNARFARFSVVVLHATVPILCAPTFFTSYVAPVRKASTDERCGYERAYDLDYTTEAYLIEVAMWTFGIFFKLIPSILIAVLSFYLISSLKKYNEKKDRLTGKKGHHDEDGLVVPPPPTTTTKSGGRQYHRHHKKLSERQTLRGAEEKQGGGGGLGGSLRLPTDDRCAKRRNARITLTKMLVIVALFCAAVELPHGIVNLLTAVFGQDFGQEVYDNLGDFFEMLTLAYSSVNFVLYCVMSTEFQRTFRQIFCVPIREAIVYRLLGRPMPIKKGTDPTTYMYRSSYTETVY